MYDKIYEYLFIDGYKHITEIKNGLYSVEINGVFFVIRVYVDDWNIEDNEEGYSFFPKNEAEIYHHEASEMDTFVRLKLNLMFLERLQRLKSQYPSLFSKTNTIGYTQLGLLSSQEEMNAYKAQ